METFSTSDGVAISAVGVISICSLVGNLASLWVIIRTPRFHGSFGILSAGYIQCNIQSIIAIFIWSFLVLVVNPELNSLATRATRIPGQLSIVGFYGTVFVHFVLALNRFCAIVYPMRYKQLFSNRNTIILLLSIWIFWISMTSIVYFNGCEMEFDSEMYTWIFNRDTTCGLFMSFGADYATSMTFIALMVAVDTVTLIKARTLRKRMDNLCRAAKLRNGRNSSAEMKLFNQTCFAAAVFIIHLIFYHFYKFVTSNLWVVFICTTCNWIATQGIVGTLLFACNCKLLWQRYAGDSAVIAAQRIGPIRAIRAKSQPNNLVTYHMSPIVALKAAPSTAQMSAIQVPKSVYRTSSLTPPSHRLQLLSNCSQGEEERESRRESKEGRGKRLRSSRNFQKNASDYDHGKE